MTLPEIVRPSHLNIPRLVTVNARHLVVNQDITIDEAEGIAQQLFLGGEDIKFALGDLYLYTEEHHGSDVASQIIPEGKAESFMRYVRVANTYSPDQRSYDVDWSIYDKLKHRDDREFWLEKAEVNNYSVRELTDAMREDGERRETPSEKLERLSDYVDRAVETLRSDGYEGKAYGLLAKARE